MHEVSRWVPIPYCTVRGESERPSLLLLGTRRQRRGCESGFDYSHINMFVFHRFPSVETPFQKIIINARRVRAIEFVYAHIAIRTHIFARVYLTQTRTFLAAKAPNVANNWARMYLNIYENDQLSIGCFEALRSS